ncbi:MAG: FGGY family carbohydrate kinase [Actinobacteria bacterium]|nr:FGGY family carbohydrate kinase [Actinomycetota bacterium]
MNKYLIGIDIGQTNIKCGLYSESGQLIRKTARSLKFYTDSSGKVEQKPYDWWNNVKAALKELNSNDKKMRNVIGLGLSTMGGILVFADSKKEPICNSLGIVDIRSKLAFDELIKLKSPEYFYRKTGWYNVAGLPLASAYWFKKNCKEYFTKNHYMMFVSNWLIYKLTGKSILDKTNAAISMLFDINKGAWDEELLEIAGINKKQLSSVLHSGYPVGKIKEDVATELGLNKDVIVANSAHDQYACALGVGAISANEFLISTGTAWVTLAFTNRLIFDEINYFSPGYHVIDGLFGFLAVIPTGGRILEWFVDEIILKRGKTKRNFYKDENIKKFANLRQKLLFLPYLSGTNAPNWDRDIKAAWLGMSLTTNSYDLLVSIMESLCFELKLYIDSYKKEVKPSCFFVTGGATKSKIWMKMLADITGHALRIPQDNEAGIRGAAIMGAVGCGVFSDFHEAIKNFMSDYTEILPEQEEFESYLKLFQIYKEITRETMKTNKSLFNFNLEYKKKNNEHTGK